MDAVDKQQLNDTTKRVTELHTLMVKNGFANAVKTTQAELVDLRLKFDKYLKGERGATCFYKIAQEAKTEEIKKSDTRLVIYIGIILTAFEIFDLTLPYLKATWGAG